MSDEVYVSVDIESDGRIPGPNSMLSLGAAAFTIKDGLINTFSSNLETLPGASADPDTTAWWETQPEAWENCRRNPRDPVTVMREFVAWVKGLGGKPVCVCYPAGYDFLFIYWYLIRFAGESPFSFSALDVKSYAMARLHLPYRDCVKRNFPKEWFGPSRHTHVALDDAIEQGQLFINMLKSNNKKQFK